MKNLITRETWLSLLAQASVEELDSLRNTMQPNQKIQVMKILFLLEQLKDFIEQPIKGKVGSKQI